MLILAFLSFSCRRLHRFIGLRQFHRFQHAQCCQPFRSTSGNRQILRRWTLNETTFTMELKGSGIANLESADKVLKRLTPSFFLTPRLFFFLNASNGFRSAFHNRFFPHHATMRPVPVLCWVHVWPQAQKISLTPHPPKKEHMAFNMA